MPKDDFTRFLSWLFGVILAASLTTVALVLIVDPYNLYRLVTIKGFNSAKPYPDRYQDEIKTTSALAIRANALLLGNSRMEVGLDPGFPGFAARDLSAYNLAIAGTTINTAVRQVNYLVKAGVIPKFVAVGVDFLDFLTDPRLPLKPYVVPIAHGVEKLAWRFDTLFSLASLADALTTVRMQNNPNASVITERGQLPLLEYKAIARQDGYYILFLQRAQENARIYLNKPHGLTQSDTNSSVDLDGFRALLKAAADNRFELHVIIYPYHAQILILFEETGLWPVFEQWKSLLVSEITRMRSRHPTLQVTLWDFSGFGGLHCERIPAKDDKNAVTQWYWEAGHFKTELGDKILARILHGGQPTAPVSESESFGFELDNVNFTLNKQRIALERNLCEKDYPRLFSDTRLLAQQTKKAMGSK